MRRMLSATFLLVFAVCSIPAQQRDLETSKTSGEKRVALVIGNAAYTNSPLLNPTNDAKGMSKALTELGFEVIHKENVTQQEMKKAMRDFGERIRNGGIGLFYYAGHGVQVDGRNYLIPVGADIRKENEVEYEAVDVGLVLAQMENAGNRVNIVILDSCRNNPFMESSRSLNRGLAIMSAPRGTLIAFATAPGKVASDGSGKNGVYTQELLNSMKEAGLRIEDVFKRVRRAVRDRTNGEQIPWEASSLEGDVYLAGAFSPQNATSLVGNLRGLEIAIQKYASKIRQFPVSAGMYKEELQKIVHEFEANPDYEKQYPQLGALIYRVQSASLMLSLGIGSDLFKQLELAFPSLRKSIKLGTHFKDYKELKEAGDFVRNILQRHPSSLPLHDLLKYEFRVAMVEASEKEIEKQVAETTQMVSSLAKGTPEENSKALNEKQAAAMELGFAIGSKLMLVALPLANRKKSYADLIYSDDDLSSLMRKLGIGESQSKSLLDNVQNAMVNVDITSSAREVLEGANLIKSVLESHGDNILMRVFRIGFILGICLESSSIALTLNITDSQIPSYIAIMDKYKIGLSDDVLLSGLPNGIKRIIQEANIKPKSVADLKRVIGSCKSVLAITKGR